MNPLIENDMLKMLRFSDKVTFSIGTKTPTKYQSCVGAWVREGDIVVMSRVSICQFKRTDMDAHTCKPYVVVPSGDGFKRLEYVGDHPERVCDGEITYIWPFAWQRAMQHEDPCTVHVQCGEFREYLKKARAFYKRLKKKQTKVVTVCLFDNKIQVRCGRLNVSIEDLSVFEDTKEVISLVQSADVDRDVRFGFDVDYVYRFLNLFGKKRDILHISFDRSKEDHRSITFTLQGSGHILHLACYI